MYMAWIQSYLTYRIAKIRSLPWETGAILPERIKNDTLSAGENDYFAEYRRCLTEYSETVECDLVSDMEVRRGVKSIPPVFCGLAIVANNYQIISF